MLYFLIINYQSSSLIERLIKSLPNNYPDCCRLVIVNNSPEDSKLNNLANDCLKIIEAQKNLGFGRACNLGLDWIYTQNNQSIVWLLNPDAYFTQEISAQTEPLKDAITLFKQNPQISVLGTVVNNSTGQITSAGGTFNPQNGALSVMDSLPANLTQDYYPSDWVSGCSLLINFKNFPQVPQFCDRYFLYYEDLDFCLRYGQQGHKIMMTHRLKVCHDTSTITNRNTLQKYRHITQSYLIHLEKHSNLQIFLLTHLRMSFNTLRLMLLKPQQGLGKLIGIYEYWYNRISKTYG